MFLAAGWGLATSTAQESGATDEFYRFPPQTFYQQEDIDNDVRAWYSKQLAALQEKALFRRIDEPTQIIRLTLLPAMTLHSMAVRIEMSGQGITLTAKKAPMQDSDDPGVLSLEKYAELTPRQWEELQARLADADFWNQPTTEETSGRDGAQWIVEGVGGGRYQVVDRWSPDSQSPYGRLTAYMLELAGFP